ncbi:selenocysteine methyltransferase [Harpegnathos saltator]|uniref:Homocysteine S-methyltransferase 2 n=1 Tax=Harpegnathos saltator TaxID=610380 RepID=E2C780_HARSA|nr:selenocysteine methyltransferase [Harpegnathos saltator]EFN76193.1 Homocysteine S-methyltransferase 2 [Harpegnathos saltator]
MENLMVLDGDSEAQLYQRLKPSKELEKIIALYAVEYHKEEVIETYLDFLRAGAQIIRTNTYRLSDYTIEKYFKPESSQFYTELMEKSVKLARAAVTKYLEEKRKDPKYSELFDRCEILVAGCCGSSVVSECVDKYELTLKDTQIAAQLIYFHHNDRVIELVKYGVDILTFESIPSLVETDIIISIMKRHHPIRGWITFLCRADGKLLDGNTLETVAMRCYDALGHQIIAIGAECPVPDVMKSIVLDIGILKLSHEVQVPFVLYIDKVHLPITENKEASNSLMSDYVDEWLDHGIRYIGGGINTRPEDVALIRKQVDDYRIFSQRPFTTLRPSSYKTTKKQSKL